MSVPLLLLLLLGSVAWAQPVRLQTENRVNPIGMDVTAPRLGWNSTNGIQTAYQVRAASSAALLQIGFADLWNSGKVTSGESQNIVYGDAALHSRDRVYWQVRVWSEPDSSTPSDWSAPASFEMGLLSPRDWLAQWISHPTWTYGQPLPVFQQAFVVGQAVRRARLYITGLGMYSATLNGAAVSADILTPGNTDYSKQVEYATYDVTAQLLQGANTIQVGLGNGMYNTVDTPGRFVSLKLPAPSPLKMIAQLEITYEDESTLAVYSGPDWQTALGATVFSSWFGGEDYDARMVPADWTNASLSTPPSPATVLSWRAAPPVRVFETVKPVAVSQVKSGVYLFDMGVNFAGYQQLQVSGPAGTRITLSIAEILNPDGSLNVQTMGGMPIFDTYTLSGNGVETWHPTFVYHGFRYLLVEGLPAAPTADTITGFVVRGANEVSGSFTSSNPLLNSIHTIINRAIQSNMISIFTDCPDREKLGWLGDLNGVFGSITRNYDISAYIRTIARNMAEGQTDTGLVPDFVPAYADYSIYGEPFRDDPNWGDAMILALYNAYLTYGDARLLQTYYPNMKSFLGHLTSKSKRNLLDYGLNDWNIPVQNTPTEIVATYGYYRSAVTLSKIAVLLGNQKDADTYAALATSIASAFNAKYLDLANHTYDTGQQAAMAMALDMGVVPATEQKAVVDNLVASIRAAGNHVNTGVVAWQAFIRALSAAGRDDVLFDVATQTTSPSYGFQIAHGATSLTESWDGPLAGDSQNHLMFGALDEWFTSNLVGIQQAPGSIGYKQLVIKPSVVGGLTSASGTLLTAQGMVAAGWTLNPAGQFELKVTIPGNTTATIVMPDASSQNVSAGSYSFTTTLQ